jgi:hypothetical protein
MNTELELIFVLQKEMCGWHDERMNTVASFFSNQTCNIQNKDFFDKTLSKQVLLNRAVKSCFGVKIINWSELETGGRKIPSGYNEILKH